MSEPTVKCPHCGKPTIFSSANPHRPFCSDRCQLLDLGRWASQKYGIPGEPVETQSNVNQNPQEGGEESGEESTSPDKKKN